MINYKMKRYKVEPYLDSDSLKINVSKDYEILKATGGVIGFYFEWEPQLSNEYYYQSIYIDDMQISGAWGKQFYIGYEAKCDFELKMIGKNLYHFNIYLGPLFCGEDYFDYYAFPQMRIEYKKNV